MKHLNLYLLIAMTLNQERIEEIQQRFTKPEACLQDLKWHINWDEWQNLFEQEGFLNSCDQVKAVFAEFDENLPLWKVYESLREEPFVVNVVCQVPTRRPDGRSLRLIYALDQKNRAVGLVDYNQQHEIDKAESEGRDPDLEHHRVTVSLVPGVTEAVKIRALYSKASEDGQQEASEDMQYSQDNGDIITESDWIPLPGLEATAATES